MNIGILWVPINSQQSKSSRFTSEKRLYRICSRYESPIVQARVFVPRLLIIWNISHLATNTRACTTNISISVCVILLKLSLPRIHNLICWVWRRIILPYTEYNIRPAGSYTEYTIQLAGCYIQYILAGSYTEADCWEMKICLLFCKIKINSKGPSNWIGTCLVQDSFLPWKMLRPPFINLKKPSPPPQCSQIMAHTVLGNQPKNIS